MVRRFRQYQEWKDAARSDGAAVEVIRSHDYPHPDDATDPVVALVKVADEGHEHELEVGFWDQEGDIGYLAASPDEWLVFEHEGDGGIEEGCDVCGREDCGGHALAF